MRARRLAVHGRGRSDAFLLPLFNDLLQLVIATIFLILYSGLLAACSPYKEMSDNILALLLSMILVLFFIAAMVFQVISNFKPLHEGAYTIEEMSVDFEFVLVAAVILSLGLGALHIIRTAL